MLYRIIILLSIFLLTTSFQVEKKHYRCHFSTVKINAQEYDLVIEILIDKGFSIPSCVVDVLDSFNIPTKIDFVPSAKYCLVGKVTESTLLKINSDVFDSNMLVHRNKAVFRQRVKIIREANFDILASLEFIVFNYNCAIFDEPVKARFGISNK